MCVPAALEVFRSLLSSPDTLSWIGMGFAAVAGRSPGTRTVRPLKVSHVVAHAGFSELARIPLPRDSKHPQHRAAWVLRQCLACP